MNYTHQSITSLMELKPGDHIAVDTSLAEPVAKTSHKENSHHLLVVRAIDHTHAQVIHSVAATSHGVKEERKRYSPRHVTVLDYKSIYNREAAITRAKYLHSMNREFVWRDSENFVIESCTGKSRVQPSKIKIGGAVRSGVGIGAGALIGGILGSVVPGIGTAIGATLGAAIVGAGAGTTAIATAIADRAGGAGMKRACCIYLYPHILHVMLWPHVHVF